jgi:diguanylate cyclase (GGDEF)-like protein
VSGGDTLRRLAAEMREEAMALAAEVAAGVDVLGHVAAPERFGDIPIFIHELAGQIEVPEAGRAARESPLASLARDHARGREQLGFAPRDVVTEFLLLRRVLWRHVAKESADLDADELLVVERRLNDALDRIVAECVVAYFDRATESLARQAHQDPLTGLLNHQAFSDELAEELERAKRYGHGVALVFMDVDRFKAINDTLGHHEGDRVLRTVASLLIETARRSDLAGRMGGDEFVVALIESDEAGARAFVERLETKIAALPEGFTVSAGWALYPEEADDADALFRLADSRSYEVKRAREP